MQHEVGDERLLERGREPLDELVRQAADEADRVGDEIAAPVVGERARRRVERLEQAVLDRDLGAGERIQERGLADVRVPGESDGRRLRAATRLPSRVALAAELGEAALEDRRRGCGRCRRSVSSCVSPGPRVPTPPPRRSRCFHMPAHARQVVLELGELDLELALGADGVLGEDVEDQLRAVDDASLERVLEQPLLGRLELVVDDQHVRGRLAERLLQLLELPLADVRARVGPRAVLDDLVDGLDAGRPGQLAQLGQLLGLASGLEHGDGEPALGLRAGRRIGLPGRHRWIMPLRGRTASVRAMHVSPVLAAQATYPFVRIEQAKREAAADGVEIFDFGQGDPREPTDPLIQQALVDALGETKRVSEGGGPAGAARRDRGLARAALRCRRRSGDRDRADAREQGGDLQLRAGRARSARPARTPCSSPSPAIRCRSAARCSPAREVVHVPLREENGFLPDLDAIDAETLARTAILWLNYPNNPTAAVAPLSLYEQRRRAGARARLPRSPRTRPTASCGSPSRRRRRCRSPSDRTSSSSTRSASARR